MGAVEAMTSAWTPRSKIQQVEDRPRNNAPNPLVPVVAFGPRFGCFPEAGWVVPSALLLSCFLASSCSFVIVFCMEDEGDDDGVGTTTSSRQKRCAGDTPCGNAPTPAPTTAIK